MIVLFKKEHPTWGLKKCHEILPEFFNSITKNQFTGVAAVLKREGSPAAKVRRGGSGTTKKIDSPTKRAVLDLAVTPPRHQRRHSSQREICRELQLSKGTVFRILQKSDLKCYRRIKCNILTNTHQQA